MGSMTLLGCGKPPVAAAGFQGVGDVQSSATAWYGLRAYNAAYATGSNPALIVVDQAKANDLTVNILSTGALDVASISTWVTANSVTTIKVKQIYDQVGTNHMVTAGAGGTLIQMPKLVLSGFGSLPIINFDDPANQSMSGPTSLGHATYSISTVAKRVSGTSLSIIFGASNANGTVYFNGANTAGLYAGGATADFGAGSVTDGSFWTLQGYFAGGAGSIGQYGSTATGSLNPGSASMSAPGVGSTSFQPTMHWVEGGIWSGDKSTTFNAVNTNAKAYWGY